MTSPFYFFLFVYVDGNLARYCMQIDLESPKVVNVCTDHDAHPDVLVNFYREPQIKAIFTDLLPLDIYNGVVVDVQLIDGYINHAGTNDQ